MATEALQGVYHSCRRTDLGAEVIDVGSAPHDSVEKLVPGVCLISIKTERPATTIMSIYHGQISSTVNGARNLKAYSFKLACIRLGKAIDEF